MSANAMRLLPVLLQQLGHKFDLTKKANGHPSIIISTNLVAFESLMLYTKIQPQSFLSSGEKRFSSVLPYMGMTVILSNGADTFEQIVNILSTERRPHVNYVKSSENCFKEEDI